MRHIGVIFSLLVAICSQVRADDFAQPRIYRSSSKSIEASSTKATTIRGLLKRQGCYPGYGMCRNTGACCPLGGDCCSDGHCCPSGEWCGYPGHCCYTNQNSCENRGCCYKTEQCCRDGGCCPAGSYCVLGTNGVGGCCPNGKTCYGPVGGGGGSGGNGGGSGGNGGGSGGNGGGNGGEGGGNSGGSGGGGGNTSPTSSSTTPTPTFSPTSTSDPITVSLTQATPTPSPGFTNVVIGVTSVQITWTSEWTIQASTCRGGQSKITTTTGQSFTFITSPNSGPYAYIDLSVQGASFAVFINGVQADVNLAELMTNCTYHQLGPLRTGTLTNNITVYVYGPLMSGRQLGNTGVPWSFALNSFILQQQSSASTTGLGLLPTIGNAASKAGPRMMTISSVVSLLLAVALFHV